MIDAGVIAPLDAAAIRRACALTIDWHLEVLAEVDSTNDIASGLAAQRPDVPLVAVIAEYQRAGRGRRGKRWQAAPRTGIHLSVARRVRTTHPLSAVSLAVAVGVQQALAQFGAVGIALKWPNDIVRSVRHETSFEKLGGVLLEASASGDDVALVVGVGLNVVMAPQVREELARLPSAYPVTDLVSAGLSPQHRNALVGALIAKLASTVATFEAQGLAPFAERWSALDVLRGKRVQVLAGDGEARVGEACGIDVDGALRVRDAAGEVIAVHFGEVSVRRA